MLSKPTLALLFLCLASFASHAAERYTLPSEQWHLIVVPGASDGQTLGELLGDALPINDFGTTWIAYPFDSNQGIYAPDISVDYPLDAGEAFWLRQTTGADVTLIAQAAPAPDRVRGQGCVSSSEECFSISLGSQASTGHWVMAGSPDHSETDVADIRFVNTTDCSAGCSLPAAASRGFIGPAIFSFDADANSFTAYESSGTLPAWSGFWIFVYGEAAGTEPALLMPHDLTSRTAGGSSDTDTTDGGSDGTDGGTDDGTTDGGSDDTDGGTTDGSDSLALTASDAITTQSDGQIIENLLITASDSDRCGINIAGHDNVVIRNVEIRHHRNGICALNATRADISNVKLINTSAPSAGPHCSGCADDRLGIRLERSPDAQVSRVLSQQASTAVYVLGSNAASLSEIVCDDMRGPLPRGQCVQFNNSPNGSLNNFYVKGYQGVSDQEDSVNAYQSDGVSISNGLIDGNWDTTGAGIIADQGSDDVSVSDIDILNAGVGVSVYSDVASQTGRNFTATGIRVKDSHCDHTGNGLIFAIGPNAQNPQFRDSQYANHCREQTVWCAPGASCRKNSGGRVELTQSDFTPRSPLQLSFPWE